MLLISEDEFMYLLQHVVCHTEGDLIARKLSFKWENIRKNLCWVPAGVSPITSRSLYHQISQPVESMSSCRGLRPNS